MTTDVRVRTFEQPTHEARVERVEAITSILRLHSSRQLIEPDKCQCGATVTEHNLHTHAVEQALIGLPLVPVVTAPPDAELVDRARDELLGDELGVLGSQDSADAVEWWQPRITRMHSTVYAPVIDALATEISTAALAWETLAGLYSDVVAEHHEERRLLGAEREAMRVERDQAHAKARLLGKANGRASRTIGELRAHNVRLRDQRFDAMTNRGAAIADLAATQRQVQRQQDTIRDLLTRVRELGGTVDDAELLSVADMTPAASPAVSIQ